MRQGAERALHALTAMTNHTLWNFSHRGRVVEGMDGRDNEQVTNQGSWG